MIPPHPPTPPPHPNPTPPHPHLLFLQTSQGHDRSDGTGWGLDDEEMIKDGIRAMHTHLKKDGVLVVGHNKLPNRGNCCGYFSPLFSPHGFGGLPTVHEDPESETKHVYEFLTKNDV